MHFKLIPITDSDLIPYKTMAQEAFQTGFESYFGSTTEVILPDEDIEKSLHTPGAIAYKAMVDDKMVGGAVVVIDELTQHNHLHFLFVQSDTQGKGIGKSIWFEIEKLHPQTKIWETCTPYFDKRNIHLYVNTCGFHIVAFFHKKHPMPHCPDDFVGDGEEGMFEFKKYCHSHPIE